MNIGLTEILFVIIIAFCVIKPENAGKAVSAFTGTLKALKQAYRRFSNEVGTMGDDLLSTTGQLNEERPQAAKTEDDVPLKEG